MLRISLGILVSLVAVAEVVAAVRLTKDWKPPTKIVQTSSGPIIGEEMLYILCRYKAFRGIPYAAPPVGDLRFKDPQPPANWTDVRYTQVYGKICHQPTKTMRASEDCLTLNVATPSLGEDGLKPVLVWIHGGGFRLGDSTDAIYGPEYLVQENITVVTLNYRLGPLGFLSTNTSDASGNWGLKDQVAALRWVQKNIANFGGDPNKVTIYGESAGGVSAHMHLLSPLSKGLFHKVISASGTGINNWSVKSPEQSSNFSMNLARLLGASEADITDPAKRVQFLRTADPGTMCERAAQAGSKKDLITPQGDPMPFAPVIENPVTQGAFLTEDPKKVLQEGRFTKMPMMMGVTDLEGGALSKVVTPEALKEIEKNVCVILPEALKNPVLARNECAQVAQEIRGTYFDGKPFNSSMLNFAYLGGDIFMTRQVYVAQRLHARLSTKDAPIYNYIFAFDGRWNILKKLLNVTLPGAIHADELGYVFMPSSRKWPIATSRKWPRSDQLDRIAPEIITQSRMVRLIGNFVKFGNPTPAVSSLIPLIWEPATADAAKAIVIGNELKMENDFLKNRMDLWDRLYEKYTGSPLFV